MVPPSIVLQLYFEQASATIEFMKFSQCYRMLLHLHKNISVYGCYLIVIIYFESCEKWLHESVHQLIPFFCRGSFCYSGDAIPEQSGTKTEKSSLSRSSRSCNIECMLVEQIPKDSSISRYVTWRSWIISSLAQRLFLDDLLDYRLRARAGEQSMETSIVSIVSKFRESRLFFLTIDGFPFFFAHHYAFPITFLAGVGKRTSELICKYIKK